MPDPGNVDTVRTTSIGLPGRALNSARTQHFILDSSSGPSEALTNSEAFLAGISSCGVTLIEKYAQQVALPVRRIAVTISGTRGATPARFERIEMRFEIHGVGQKDAERLVAVWQERWPLYRTVAVATDVSIEVAAAGAWRAEAGLERPIPFLVSSFRRRRAVVSGHENMTLMADVGSNLLDIDDPGPVFAEILLGLRAGIIE